MAEISNAARDAATAAVHAALKPDVRMDRNVYESDLIDAALTAAAPHIEAEALREAVEEEAELIELPSGTRVNAVKVWSLLKRADEIEGGSDA